MLSMPGNYETALWDRFSSCDDSLGSIVVREREQDGRPIDVSGSVVQTWEFEPHVIVYNKLQILKQR